MATRRNKLARKGKRRQASKKAHVKEPKKRKAPPKPAPKKRKAPPKPAPKKRKAPPKPAPKKRRAPPKPAPKKRTPPKPPKPPKIRPFRNRKKRNRIRRTPLRGVNGLEREIRVEQYWQDVSEGDLEYQVDRVFRQIFATLASSKPTMYARFTFMITGVRSALRVGSPPVVFKNAGKSRAWFIVTPVSYTVEGVMHFFRQTWDDIDREIGEAENANASPTFFLEHVTCIAYNVGGQK